VKSHLVSGTGEKEKEYLSQNFNKKQSCEWENTLSLEGSSDFILLSGGKHY